jgi:metal-responsive CopG/Arc/MetJ family transcriptional regulator
MRVALGMTLDLRMLGMADQTIRTHVVFPKELVETVDRLVGPRKRSAFLVQAVEEKIGRERLGRALAKTAGFLTEGTHPEWETPEQVSSWVHELRSLDRDAHERKLDHHG